jgi:hypothetical protein
MKLVPLIKHQIKRHPETVILLLSHGGALSYFTLAKLQLVNGYQKLLKFNFNHASLISQVTHALRLHPWLLLIFLGFLILLFQMVHRVARWGVIIANFAVLMHLVGMF